MSNAWSGGSDTRWRTFRAAILQRDGHRCKIGGEKCTTVATHVDHIVPLSMGGEKYDPLNCRAACATCNTGRRVSAGQYEPEPKLNISSW